MWSKLLTAAGLTLAFAAPVAAQQSTPPQPPAGSTSSGQQSTTAGQNSMQIQQRLKQDLEQAGFKNVQIMPESFLVRAHDKQDRPVMMVINPDSVTAVTQMSASGQPSSGGSGSSSSGSSTPAK